AWSRDFLRAVDGARRWAPLLLGLGCVGIWLLGFQAAQMAIASWERDTGHGTMVIGYWIAGLGVGIVAIVGAYATLRYHEGQTGDPPAPRRRSARGRFGPMSGRSSPGSAGSPVSSAVRGWRSRRSRRSRSPRRW